MKGREETEVGVDHVLQAAASVWQYTHRQLLENTENIIVSKGTFFIVCLFYKKTVAHSQTSERSQERNRKLISKKDREVLAVHLQVRMENQPTFIRLLTQSGIIFTFPIPVGRLNLASPSGPPPTSLSYPSQYSSLEKDLPHSSEPIRPNVTPDLNTYCLTFCYP